MSSQPLAEIFSQGDEVVTGEIADTNAAWLSRELVALGFEVARHTAVGDHLDALAAVLGEIAGRADLCLCSGGLGPTCDDLTAEAVGRAFGLPLELDPVALAQVEAWFARMGRAMPAVNRKQALLPQGAERLDNLWGTAPGFALRAGRCRFVFMPGVPGEMRAMFGHWVKPDLPECFALDPARLVVLHTVGIGESALQERLDRLGLPSGVRLGFRAGGPENQVKLGFPAGFPDGEREATVARVASAIGDELSGIDAGANGADSLVAAVGRGLEARGARLFVGETVSGGLIGQRCSGEPWLLGAVTAPDLAQLAAWLGAAGTEEGGAGSTPLSLARHARRLTGAEFALVHGAQGDAGVRGGAGEAVEVGFALAGPDGEHTFSRVVAGSRSRQQAAAAAYALDFLRRRVRP